MRENAEKMPANWTQKRESMTRRNAIKAGRNEGKLKKKCQVKGSTNKEKTIFFCACNPDFKSNNFSDIIYFYSTVTFFLFFSVINIFECFGSKR